MFGFLADVMGIATRQERWSGPDHLHDHARRKSAWEIERDLAREKERAMRKPGLF